MSVPHAHAAVVAAGDDAAAGVHGERVDAALVPALGLFVLVIVRLVPLDQLLDGVAHRQRFGPVVIPVPGREGQLSPVALHELEQPMEAAPRCGARAVLLVHGLLQPLHLHFRR